MRQHYDETVQENREGVKTWQLSLRSSDKKVKDYKLTVFEMTMKALWRVDWLKTMLRKDDGEELFLRNEGKDELAPLSKKK